MTRPNSFHLFERFGVELEYMIVDLKTLDVKPITDEVLKSVAGHYTNEVERGAVTWSNELVLHVIELKATEPLATLHGAHVEYQANIRAINDILAPMGARLMPTAMHPWMDPYINTRLWPHDNNEIYDAFNAVFDCRGHGWANLQSVHLNLPFATTEEFAKLHAAIRLLMPIMPALSASSPIMDLRDTGILDNRMDVYRLNCKRIPSVTGLVIPEPVFTPDDYERVILQQMYREIAPHDPEGILQDEWLNARGAIARFERNTIEVRVLDVQECPQADLAIVTLIAAVLKDLIAGRWLALQDQKQWSTEALHAILLDVIRSGESTPIGNDDYAKAFGLENAATAGEIWRALAEMCSDALDEAPEDVRQALDVILTQGTLATRIIRSLNDDFSRDRVTRVYGALCDCLAEGKPYLA